jgi:cell division transport system permease protein
VSLKPAYRTSSRVESIARRIRKLEGVDDVKYRKLFLRILDRRYKIILRIMLAAGVVLSFLSILLVINTIRLTIYAKRKIIKTMQLVGATRGFIIFPFVIQGFIQGLIAGLISGGLSYILIEVLSRRIPDNILSQIDMPDWFYGAVVGFSSLLGLIGSWISARKFITYKIMN